jgi:hypothetical protein
MHGLKNKQPWTWESILNWVIKRRTELLVPFKFDSDESNKCVCFVIDLWTMSLQGCFCVCVILQNRKGLSRMHTAELKKRTRGYQQAETLRNLWKLPGRWTPKKKPINAKGSDQHIMSSWEMDGFPEPSLQICQAQNSRAGHRANGQLADTSKASSSGPDLTLPNTDSSWQASVPKFHSHGRKWVIYLWLPTRGRKGVEWGPA